MKDLLKKVVFSILALTCISGNVLAQDQEYSVYLRKSAIVADTVLVIDDPEGIDTSGNVFQKRGLFVKLNYVRDQHTDYSTLPQWSYTLVYDVINKDDFSMFFRDTISINYHQESAFCKLSDFKYYRVGWTDFIVKVVGVLATSGTSTTYLGKPETYPFLPEDIELEVALESKKMGTYAGGQLTGVQIVPVSDFGKFFVPYEACNPDRPYIQWQHQSNVLEYEMEYVYIPDQYYYHNGSTSGYFNALVSSSTLSYNEAFNHADAVRVTTTDNYYPLPEEYPTDGKLYFRVRGVGRWMNSTLQDYEQPIFGSWTNVSSPSQPYTVDFSSEYNWQLVTTFAEEGKFKKVISYYDGLNRPRQSLTHLNTDQTTIIQETVYDHEGRGVVNMMPYPEMCYDLSYHAGIRKDMSNNTWDKEDFELLANVNSADGELVNNIAGSSMYYSAQNPFLGISQVNSVSGYTVYTPDAELYPYTRIEYTMDNTGRITCSSGVGPTHKLGSGHETKYFYANTNDFELRRLFGSNVGKASHYKKNMVVDANGQVSVSYMDQEGRVIATALAGNSPDNLIRLDSWDQVPAYTDLMPNNIIDVSNGTSTVVYNIGNTMPNTEYTFNYSVFHDLFISDPLQECIGCAFDLEISIDDPEGNNVYSHTEIIRPNTPYPEHCGYSFPPSGPNQSQSFTVEFDEIGTYKLTKTLRWREQEMLDSIMVQLREDNVDIYNVILASFMSNIDYTDCEYFCESGCEDENEVRDGAFLSECKSLLYQMANHVSPGGYFFEGDNTSDPAADSYITGFDFFQEVVNAYGTHSSPPLYLYLPDGTVVDENDINSSYLTDHWRSDWGEELARVHPEYCHYEVCILYNDNTNPYSSSGKFDYEMTQETSINAQYSTGFLNPQDCDPILNIAPYNLNPFNTAITFSPVGSTSPNRTDPWPGPGLYGDIYTHNLEPYRNYQGDDYSIWSFAYHTNNPDNFPSGFNLGYTSTYTDVTTNLPVTQTADDFLWNVFRGSYLQAKTEYRYGKYSPDLGCLIQNYPKRVVKGPPSDMPQTNAGSQQTNEDLMEEWGDVGSPLCEERCSVKTEVILEQLLGNCVTLEHLREDLYTQSSAADMYDDLYGYCLSNCGPMNPLALISDNEWQLAVNTGSPSALRDVLDAMNNVQSYLISAGLNCQVSTDIDFITEFIGDESFKTYYEEYTTEHCVQAPCMEDDAAIRYYIYNTIGGALVNWNGETNPQHITVPVTNSENADQCTICGCIPPVTPVRTEGTTTGYYPSYSCIPLSRNCTNSEAEGYLDCSSVFPTSGTLHPDNTTPLGSYNGVDIYPYPKYDYSCEGNCYIRFFTLQDGVETPVPVSSIYNIYYVNQSTYLGNRTYTGTMEVDLIDALTPLYLTGDPQYCTIYDNVTIHFEMNLSGCAGEITCTEETFVVPHTYPVEFSYSEVQQDCIDNLENQAEQQALDAFEQYLQAQASDLLEKARIQCMTVTEYFTMQYELTEHHYTLYYYDQAANLVQTVPPLGVHPVMSSHFPIQLFYAWDGTEPVHDYLTRYQYTSLNQPLEQQTPDGGLTAFYYDDKGRITHSQNAKQRGVSTYNWNIYDGEFNITAFYSFTDYDDLGRISMVCERNDIFDREGTFGNPDYSPYGLSTDALTTRTDAQITRTYYDDGLFISALQFGPENTRNRVAYTTFQEYEGVKYDVASHYSYDIHGNVKTLVTENNHLYNFSAERYKRTDYKYDLISGKVNEVHYQSGRTDKFYHRYTYDADNRLTMAETSADFIAYETDARYFYYYHGPLGRMEIGHRKVQASDYAYTLHGWLKGVNAGFLDPLHDMGKDGYEDVSNVNRWVARDAYGYVLDYYDNTDYSPVGTSHGNYRQFWADITSGDAIVSGLYTAPGASVPSQGLYNGNISRMHVALSDLSLTPWDVHGNLYHYDQLNRIKAGTVYAAPNMEQNRTYNSISAVQDYATTYSYDANGNLQTLLRNGNLNNSGDYSMDDFTYSYISGTNQLEYVEDNSGNNGLYQQDIDGQSGGNYEYDLIGNLVSDKSEEIEKIVWSVYGKVRQVVREKESLKPDLEFTYDPSGQRIMKVEKTKDSDGELKPVTGWKFTFYSRDAQGNIMGVYDVKANEEAGEYKLIFDEAMIYGSSRLGVWKASRPVTGSGVPPLLQYSYANQDPYVELCLPATPIDPTALGSYQEMELNTSQISVKDEYQLGAPHSSAQLLPYNAQSWTFVNTTGHKQYEFTNHLGNVLVTLSDVPTGIDSDNDNVVNYYIPRLQTVTDYYPFGMQKPGRSVQQAAPCSTYVVSSMVYTINENFSATVNPMPVVLGPSPSTTSYYVYSSNTTGQITGGEMSWSRNGGGTLSRIVAKNFTVQPGKTYTLKFKMKRSSASPSGGTYGFRVWDANNTSTLIIPVTALTLGTSYTTYSYTFNTNSLSSTAVYQILWHCYGSYDFTCYVDDFEVSYVDNVTHTVCEDADGYRFGFNGQEKDNELYGEGNSYTAEYWQYDPRTGRRWNVDPMTGEYPDQSPYAAFNNNPIYFSDPLGLEGEEPHKAIQGKGGSTLISEPGGYLSSDANTAYNSKGQGQAFWDNELGGYVSSNANFTVTGERTGSLNNQYQTSGTGTDRLGREYTYTETDLKMRERILGGWRGFRIALLNQEKAGIYEPLTGTGYYDHYGSYGSLLLFQEYVGMGLMLAEGAVGFGGAGNTRPNISRMQARYNGKTAPEVDYPTQSGDYPSWSTVQRRYWKGANAPTRQVKVRVRKSGEIKDIIQSKELHHMNGRGGNRPHKRSNLKEVWPNQHEQIDPHRNTGYDVLE